MAETPEDQRAALVERIVDSVITARDERHASGDYDWEERRDVEAILFLLESEGRLADPHHERCQHHDGFCGDIAEANGALGEALVEARAEIERLRVAMFPDRWPCPNPDDPEGCYCPGDGPCLADQIRPLEV